MLRAMLDANVCIRVMRDKPAFIRPRFHAETGSLAISAIVLYELHYGVAKSERAEVQRERLAEFVSRLIVLPFDDEASLHAGEIRADLTQKGMLIGPNDLLIAGHARSSGLKLITGNLREFSRVEGLRCEDWLAVEDAP